jgi:hypothetical protein
MEFRVGLETHHGDEGDSGQVENLPRRKTKAGKLATTRNKDMETRLSSLRRRVKCTHSARN